MDNEIKILEDAELRIILSSNNPVYRERKDIHAGMLISANIIQDMIMELKADTKKPPIGE